MKARELVFFKHIPGNLNLHPDLVAPISHRMIKTKWRGIGMETCKAMILSLQLSQLTLC